MKPRAVAIIVDPAAHAVLLIHRWKDGREYYVLPGGKIEEGETPAEACVREAREETGLEISIDAPLMTIQNLGRAETYFHTTRFHGTLELGFPERDYQTDNNVYQLEWVPAGQMANIELKPIEMRPVVQGLAGLPPG